MTISFDGTADERRLRDAAAAGEAAWRRLELRVRSITPAGLARFVLATAAIVLVGQLLFSAWLSLIALQVGLVLAYLVLPIVDLLDRVLPRWLAALVVTLGEIAVVLAIIGLLVPPLALEVPLLVRALPGADQIHSLIADAEVTLGALPPGVQAAITSGAQQAAGQLQGNLLGFTGLALSVFAASVLGVLGTLGFILGFIAVPTWLLGVLTDRHAGRRALDRGLPGWLRPDFWAVVHIIDRTFGSYLRGQLVRALVFGCGLYLAFDLLDRYDLAAIRFPLSLAVFATVSYLIPDIGPIVGAVPAVLAALASSPHEAVVVLATYMVVALAGVIALFFTSQIPSLPSAGAPRVRARTLMTTGRRRSRVQDESWTQRSCL